MTDLLIRDPNDSGEIVDLAATDRLTVGETTQVMHLWEPGCPPPLRLEVTDEHPQVPTLATIGDMDAKLDTTLMPPMPGQPVPYPRPEPRPTPPPAPYRARHRAQAVILDGPVVEQAPGADVPSRRDVLMASLVGFFAGAAGALAVHLLAAVIR